MESVIHFISLTGAFALAISGALTAMNKRFDPFGVLIIGFITAVGGGTLRDILLTDKEVFWMQETSYLYVIIVGCLFAILFRKKLFHFEKALLFFDAIGLGLYTAAGVQIGIDFELSGINCVILGMATGAFGGVLRDILVNEVPVIFNKDIYATVTIFGGLLYWVLNYNIEPQPFFQILPVVIMIVTRLLIT